MSGELGRASLDLEANLAQFRKDMAEGKQSSNELEHALDALVSIAGISEQALGRVKITAGQAAESKGAVESILVGVRGIGDESIAAARELDRVRITETQAVESKVAAEEISGSLDQVSRNARQATRDLTEVRLAGGKNGVGVGPFGSGFGRVGVLGTAVGAGVLSSPVLGSAALGALAALPAIAGAGVGALGTLVLAFHGVGAAIDGDRKAYDALEPSQQQFVQTVRSLSGWLDQLKEKAAAGVFPGLEKGLTEALSPGTLHAIDVALDEFSHSIGTAGEEWGRYFGSPEFQSTFAPLMKEGAKDVDLMSDAALRLFDAVGQIAVAGIPVTDWMLTAIDRGGKLADQWLKAKSATGELSSSMETAKNDLDLVGHLLGALLDVVVQFGGALHPVAQVAVKDLTDGLHKLADDIHNNEDQIQDLVGGALHLLVGALKIATGAIGDIDKATGGFKHTVELLATGLAALKIARWTDAFTKFAGIDGTAGIGAANAEAATLKTHLASLAQIGSIAIGIDLLVQAHGTKGALGILEEIGGGALVGGAVGGPLGAVIGGTAAGIKGALDAASAADGGQKGFNSQTSSAEQAALLARYPTLSSGQSRQQLYDLLGNLDAAGLSDTDRAAAIAKLAARLGQGGALSAKAAAAYNSKYGLPSLSSGITGGAGEHGALLTNALDDVKAHAGKSSVFGFDPPFTKNLGAKPAQPTGAALLSDALRDAIQQAKDKAKTTQGADAADWLNTELADLEDAKKELGKDLAGASGKRRAAIKTELRSIDGQIADVNKQITSNLKEQASAIKQSFSNEISTAKSNISSAMSTLKETLDSQLQAQLQSYITDTLGPKFFQGTDPVTGAPLMTPAEAAYQAMLDADRKQQLQDALAQAQTPEEKAAAQHAIDEDNAAAAATKSRQQADADYAAAVNQAQADYAQKQRDLDGQLAAFANGLDTGHSKLSDLSGIVSGFGLSLTADDGVISDFSSLQSAVQTLGGIYEDEAAKLAGLGASTSAAVAALDQLATSLGGQYGSSVASDSLGRYLHNQGIPGFKDGGLVSASVPTPVVFGEGGYEEALFSGAGHTLNDVLSGVGLAREEHIHFHGGTFIGGGKQQVARDLHPYLKRLD